MSTRSLLKSTGIISLATAISRVLGFVRDILIASFFGTGGPIQAFIVAFKIPNLLRHFVAEGATSSAFVPVLSEYLVTKDKDEYRHLANVLLNILVIVLVVIVLIGTAAAPFIVRVIAPGFVTEPYQLKLATDLTRVMFPYIFLVGLAAYAMGILNSLKHFSTPAFAPALLNLSIIITMLVFWRNMNVAILACAVLVGGILQFLIQLPVLYRKGIKLKMPYMLYHPAAKKVVKLLFPRLLGATVYQLNVLIDTILASLYWIVGAGGIAALYYANRLIQLPTAIFGISLATAALPTLSGHFAKKDMNKFKETLNFSLKSLFLIMIPATIGLIVLGNHIVRILFQRGEFTPYSTMITSQPLMFYSIGLFSYAGIKILVFCFYSMQDTMTPVKTASVSLAVNIIFNLILMWPLKLAGLALATSIAGACNFFLLLYLLRRKIGAFGEKHMALFLGKVIIAALVMGSALYAVKDYIGALLLQKGILFNVLYLFSSVAIGALIYFGALYLFRVQELGKFVAWILRKR
ncbi:murein biosynthesis integral membrane protein MurJ [Omnitrophica bacterium]|nr:murein biosynthesis integral membrane protein MurJ [Candidatus Omnitrophota bacterium]